MEKIKIAYLTSNLLYGGAARSLRYMLESLSSENYEFYVFSRGIGGRQISNKISKIAKDFKIVSIGQIDTNQAYSTSVKIFEKEVKKSYKWFADMLLDYQIDILHVNSTVFAHVLKYVKEIPNIKVVVHLRELIVDTINPTHAKYIINQIQTYADVLIGISENEVSNFTDHPFYRIIPNPIDFNEVNSSIGVFRNQFNITDNIILVGMFGNFYKTKGQLEFVKMAHILIKEKNLQNVKFLMVGVTKRKPLWKRVIKKCLKIDDYWEIVNNYIKDNQLDDYFYLINSTYHVYEILSDINIVVRPSLGADPWGRDILEALAFKKSIVATGVSEFIIKNNYSGFLVPARRPDLLAEKVFSLIRNPELRLKFGLNGYYTVKEMCDLSLYGKKIKEIYEILK